MANEFLKEDEGPELTDQESTGNPIEDISGEGYGKVASNPLTEADEQASPEEQEQYEDGFKRVMAMIHDVREPNDKKSMADTIIKAISTSTMPAYKTIGGTAAMIMRLFHNNAKRQNVDYSGDVLREIGMNVVVELTDVARETGAIKGLPEVDGPKEEEFTRLAVLEAAKGFGQYMLDTGQADTKTAQKDYKEQMEREGESGALDDWDMQGMEPDALDNAVAQHEGIVQEPQAPGGMPPEGAPPEGAV